VKRLITIFLVVFITVFSIGGFLIYSAYLSLYKTSYKSYIKKEQSHLNFHKISINPSELFINSQNLIWEDKNKEIIKDGILYDVISINYKNGKVELTVISDNEEQEIKKQFASQYKNNYAQPSNNLAKILKQFLSLKFLNYNCFEINSNQNTIFCSHSPYNLLKSKSIFLPQEVPPPIFI
jgi:hypothetical protein